MSSSAFQSIEEKIEPLRQSLLNHQVYQKLDDLQALQIFMQYHAFAVWDFMLLLKSLQHSLCPSGLPWLPPTNRLGARLVNEIVLAEESDIDPSGLPASHFDLYLNAMQTAGASTAAIRSFVDQVRSGGRPAEVLKQQNIPAPISQFVLRTIEIAQSGDVCQIASAFLFGREDLLPDIFSKIVNRLNSDSDGKLDAFHYYLQRHIELDGDHHGPLAQQLLTQLCGDDPMNWKLAENVATQALEARLALWDGISEAVSNPSVSPTGWHVSTAVSHH